MKGWRADRAAAKRRRSFSPDYRAARLRPMDYVGVWPKKRKKKRQQSNGRETNKSLCQQQQQRRVFLPCQCSCCFSSFHAAFFIPPLPKVKVAAHVCVATVADVQTLLAQRRAGTSASLARVWQGVKCSSLLPRCWRGKWTVRGRCAVHFLTFSDISTVLSISGNVRVDYLYLQNTSQ